MTTGLEGIPSINDFIKSLNRNQLFEGITVLERFCAQAHCEIYETKQQLKKTPKTQEMECHARIAQCKKTYHTAAGILQKYRNKYHNRPQPTPL